MATYRPGSEVPYRSRPENQEVRLTRKTYGELLRRLDDLERKLAEHTHPYRGRSSLGNSIRLTTGPASFESDENE